MFRFSLAKKAITQIFRTNEFLTAAQGKQGQFWSHRCFFAMKNGSDCILGLAFLKNIFKFFFIIIKKVFLQS